MALVAMITGFATLVGVARFWADNRAVYSILSSTTELSMAVAFYLMEMMLPAFVLCSIIYLRLTLFLGRKMLILSLPLIMSFAGWLVVAMEEAVWWMLLPILAFITSRVAEHLLRGNSMRALILPSQVMWMAHNFMSGYWAGAAHEAIQIASNIAKINVSLRPEITRFKERHESEGAIDRKPEKT